MIRPRTAAGMTLLSIGATVIGVLGSGGPAAAHVTVAADGAVQGGYTRVAFRVPNESDTAATTKLEVVLPVDTPIASVSTMAVPGWTVAVTKGRPATSVQAHGSEISEVVTKLTWTASPAAVIKAGQFAEFPVSMGPLPQADRLVFKTLQTYSDGNIVRWIEEPVDGAEEPQSPAPVLALAKATPAGDGAQATAAIGAPVATTGEDDADGGNGPAVALGAAGLVAGLAGLVLGGLAFARTRKAPVAPVS